MTHTSIWEHPLPRLREGVGEVHRRRRLPFAAQGGGDADHVAAFIAGEAEHEVGAEPLVRFGGGKVQILADGAFPIRLAGTLFSFF